MVASYLAAFQAGDPDEIAYHVSEDFENVHRSALGDSCTGRAEYRKRLPAFLSAFAELRYELLETVAEGDRVAAAYLMRAVHDGTPIQIPGMFSFVVSGGLITRRVDYFDSLTFLRQTGQT